MPAASRMADFPGALSSTSFSDQGGIAATLITGRRAVGIRGTMLLHVQNKGSSRLSWGCGGTDADNHVHVPMYPIHVCKLMSYRIICEMHICVLALQTIYNCHGI